MLQKEEEEEIREEEEYAMRNFIFAIQQRRDKHFVS
jgi:hypothetical protein